MGYIVTEVYWPNVQVPQLDLEGLEAYSLAWRRVLAHPDVRLLKPRVVKDTDVVIAKLPTPVVASSKYAVCAFLTYSWLNGDFLPEFRKIFLTI